MCRYLCVCVCVSVFFFCESGQIGSILEGVACVHTEGDFERREEFEGGMKDPREIAGHRPIAGSCRGKYAPGPVSLGDKVRSDKLADIKKDFTTRRGRTSRKLPDCDSVEGGRGVKLWLDRKNDSSLSVSPAPTLRGFCYSKSL